MSCFVNKNITGVDNVLSSLNEDLKAIFPHQIDNKTKASTYYMSVLREGGAFKSSFGVDWETVEGQKYINENYPGFLGENGEPKLYVDKLGRAYFKTPDGNFMLNQSTISENERYETVKALMASYMSDNTSDLKSFVRNTAIKNAGTLNQIKYHTKKKIDAFSELYKTPGISESEKNRIRTQVSFLQKDITRLNDSISFLRGIDKNEALTEIIMHDVKIVLESSKVAYNDDVHERENDDASAAMELGHLSPSNESNPQNSLPAEILQLISTIPKTELKFSEDGDIATHEKVASELMPLLTYIHDYSDVFKEVQKILNNVIGKRVTLSIEQVQGLSKKESEALKQSIKNTSTYEAMVEKLTQYRDESNSHIVSELLIRLEKLINSQPSEQDKINMKSKFAKAFQKAKSSNVMHTTGAGELRITVNAGAAMTNINKIDLSDEDNRADLLASEFVTRSFIKLSSKRTQAELDSIDDAKIALMTSTSYSKIKDALGKYLEKKYGMILQDKTVSQLMNNINRRSEGKEGRTKILEFLHNMENMSTLHYQKSEVITKAQKKNSNYKIGDLAKTYFGLGSEEKENIIKNFTSNGGVKTEFGLIAEMEYRNSPSSADSSIVVGSKKVWLYSFMSKMQKDIIRWKEGDVEQLENLKDTGNGMVDYLLGKEGDMYNTALSQKRIDKISLKNNMELKKALDADTAVFNKLTQEDLILMVYSNLYENRKEKYVQIEQESHKRIGGNHELQDMWDNRATANEFTFLNNADKTQTLSLAGLLKGDSAVLFNKNKEIESIGTYNVNRVMDMFHGELNKIRRTKVSIDEYNKLEDKQDKLDFAMKNFIPGWHYGITKEKDYSDPENVITKDEFLEGNYRKFGFLNGFYMSNENDINNYMFDKNKDVFKDFRHIGKESFDLMQLIDDYFTEILKTEVKELTDLTGSSERQEYSVEAGGMETVERKGLFELQTSVIHEGGEINAAKAAADFSMNYLFHSVDLFQIINGEIGMYKQKGANFNMMDALKRTSAVNADGIYAANHDPLAVEYYLPFGEKRMMTHKVRNPKAVAYLKNSKTIFAAINIQEYEQSHYGPIMQKVLDNNNKGNKLTVAGEVSDGASYSNPKFLVDFYERTYGLSKKERQLHTELMNPNLIPTQAHFDFLKKLGGSNQAGKLQSFSLIKKDDGTIVPFFWKSSVIPLYPSLTKGFPIDALRKSMVKQNIDVVGNVSAFKSLAHTSTEIFEKNTADNLIGEMKLEKDIQLNPFEIETEDIKIQVELSAKGDKEAVAGSQNLRNITANMDLNSKLKNYIHEGKSITAREMYNTYDNDIKNIIQFQLDEFLKKINYKEGGFFDQTMFRRMITDQLNDVDYDVKAILEDINMPLETIPGMSNRIFPIISSFIHKQVAKPRTNGTAAIQVANTGFNFSEKRFKDLTEEEQTSSIIFGDSMELKPPRPTGYTDYAERIGEEGRAHLDRMIDTYNENASEENQFDRKNSPIYFSEENPNVISLTKEEGFHSQIEDGDIMIPFSSIFKKSKMTWEQFKEFATTKDEDGNIIGFDQEILNNIVGYRIPNQSMSSNDSFRVVGILHPSIGDSAIIYHEITSKTGSDFDIDKMVLMLPNFKATMDVLEESSLSEANRKVINDAVKNNEIFNIMTTGKYFSMDNIYDMLFKNDRLADFADENDFDGKTEQEKVDFFVKNRDNIEWFLEKDNRKAIVYRRNEYTVKEVLKDFYNAQDQQDAVIDANLKEAGFEPRKRYVMQSVDYINDNSEKGLQNKLIRSMRSILKSSATFDDLISPLDGTYIKDSINKVRYLYFMAQNNPEGMASFEKLSEKKQQDVVKKFVDSKKKSIIASMMPNYLAQSRTDMLMAKGLTATMANHMTNIPFSQIQNVFLKYNIGLGSNSLAKTHVLGKEHLDEFKITKMVSYLMNASVDAAKDNYIIEGNYNSYTSGAAMLLIRLGIDPEEVSKIIMHPLIAKLSKEKLGSTSKIADISASYSNTKLEAMSNDLAKQINEGLVIRPDAFLENISQAGMEAKDKTGLTDEQILGFWNIAVTIGKDLNDAIKLSKPDSNGFGKTSSEAHVISNLHDTAESNSFATKDKDGNLIGGGMVFNKATNGIHPFSSDVSTVYNESTQEYESGMQGNYNASISNIAISLTNELTKGNLIERTPGFIKLLNTVMSNLGLGHSTKDAKIKRLGATLYPYVLATSGHPLYQFAEETKEYRSDMQDLLETLPKDLLKLKSSEEYSENKFLKEISIDEAKGFISFNNTANYSDLTKISIKDSANTLYADKNHQELMERLVKYCFFTTGFKPSSYSFVNYLAKQYFVDSKHDKAMSLLLNDLNDAETYVEKNIEKAMLFLAANRPEDETIIKKLKGLTVKIPKGVPVTDNSMLNKVSFTDPDTNEERFYPFVSITKSEGTLNFALTEVIPASKDGKTPAKPVYDIINVMQYVSKNDFSGKKKSDNKQQIKETYDSYDNAESESDDNGEIEFSTDEVRKITKKGRKSRMMLFNTSMADNTSVFGKESEKSLVYENNSDNVVIKNKRKLFNLDPSNEALSDAQPVSDSIKSNSAAVNFLEEANSNKEIVDYLKKMASIRPLIEGEAEQVRQKINALYAKEKNNHFKQKALNELDKLTGCNN